MPYIIVNNETKMHLIEKRHIHELYNLYKDSKTLIENWIFDVQKIIDDKNNLVKLVNRWLNDFIEEKGLYFLIEHDYKWCGVAQLEIDKYNKSGQLGFWMHPQYTRKRIAYNCARKLIEIAFMEYGLNRIEALIAVDNIKSNQGIKKLGFTKEGIKRAATVINNKKHDLVIYSLLKSEWG